MSAQWPGMQLLTPGARLHSVCSSWGAGIDLLSHSSLWWAITVQGWVLPISGSQIKAFQVDYPIPGWIIPTLGEILSRWERKVNGDPFIFPGKDFKIPRLMRWPRRGRCDGNVLGTYFIVLSREPLTAHPLTVKITQLKIYFWNLWPQRKMLFLIFGVELLETANISMILFNSVTKTRVVEGQRRQEWRPRLRSGVPEPQMFDIIAGSSGPGGETV